MYNIDYQTKAYLYNKTHVDMHTVHDGLADGTAVGLAVGLVGILVGLIVGTLEDGFAVGATAAEVNINRSLRSFPQKDVKKLSYLHSEDGFAEGVMVGLKLGEEVRIVEGMMVFGNVGVKLGDMVGLMLGSAEGI